VTIEDVEDEEVQNMMNKPKLCEDTTHIVEDMSDEEHIMFDQMNYKKKRDSASPNKESKRKPYDLPATTGRTFERPRTPDICEHNVPTLHSELYKYKGLPDLQKKWVESATDILMGAPSTPTS